MFLVISTTQDLPVVIGRSVCFWMGLIIFMSLESAMKDAMKGSDLLGTADNIQVGFLEMNFF